MIAQAPFGRTGHTSTRLIFGAAALSSMTQARADELLVVLLDHGVNHIDTAAGYGDSELRIGPWMERHRGDFFLATKTGERSGDAARAELERSLARLRVDAVDLIQLHNLVEDDEWHVAHGPGGAVEAMARARDEGLVRFIGVTGHGLRIARMHLRSLDRFPFDSVLLPFSYVGLQDDGYRRDVDELLALCADRQVAVQTIKSAAHRRWHDDDTGSRHSWYRPLADAAAIGRSVRWVLGASATVREHVERRPGARHDADAAATPVAVPDDDELRRDIDATGSSRCSTATPSSASDAGRRAARPQPGVRRAQPALRTSSQPAGGADADDQQRGQADARAGGPSSPPPPGARAPEGAAATSDVAVVGRSAATGAVVVVSGAAVVGGRG